MTVAPGAGPGTRSDQSPRPGDRLFPTRVLSGLLSWADERAVPAAALVAGLDDRDPGRLLSYDSIRLGFARARRLHGGSELGCVTGLRKSAQHLGPLGPAQLAQETLHAAMTYGVRRQRLAGSVLNIVLAIDGDLAALECHRLFDDDECGALIDVDHLLAAYNVMSAFRKAPLPLRRIELASGDAGLVAAVGRTLPAAVAGRRPVSRLVFDSALLAGPEPALRGADATLLVRGMRAGRRLPRRCAGRTSSGACCSRPTGTCAAWTNWPAD